MEWFKELLFLCFLWCCEIYFYLNIVVHYWKSCYSLFWKFKLIIYFFSLNFIGDTIKWILLLTWINIWFIKCLPFYYIHIIIFNDRFNLFFIYFIFTWYFKKCWFSFFVKYFTFFSSVAGLLDLWGRLYEI